MHNDVNGCRTLSVRQLESLTSTVVSLIKEHAIIESTGKLLQPNDTSDMKDTNYINLIDL